VSNICLRTRVDTAGHPFCLSAFRLTRSDQCRSTVDPREAGTIVMLSILSVGLSTVCLLSSHISSDELGAIPSRTAHNGLVGGSSPSGPTTQSCATGDFLKVYKRPRIGGVRCDRSFSEIESYSRQVVSAHFSLAPKSRFPETETARGRDSVRMPVTPKEVRASGAAETTRRACRRGGPLPCHEAAAPRWPLSRDRAPGRQARSSC
jgi:hypothetical protein